MRTSSARFLAAVVLLAVAAACARAWHSSNEGFSLAPAHIVFVNQTTDQATVFVVLESGESQRLGTVLAGRSDTLSIPAALVNSGASVSIVAHLLAKSYEPHTQSLALQGGDMLEIVLQPDERVLRVVPGS